jgi:hypothetical protein
LHSSRGARELQWKLAQREQLAFELKDVDNITPQQRARRTAWLRGESGLSGEGSGELKP